MQNTKKDIEIAWADLRAVRAAMQYIVREKAKISAMESYIDPYGPYDLFDGFSKLASNLNPLIASLEGAADRLLNSARAATQRADVLAQLCPVACDWSGSAEACDHDRAMDMAWEWLHQQDLDYLGRLRDELADDCAEDSGPAWLTMMTAMNSIEDKILSSYAKRPEFGHAVSIVLAVRA